MSQPLKLFLAAIMFPDIQGYTAMMQQNESNAPKTRSRHREVFQNMMQKFDRRILQYFGDGILSIFFSSVDAVRYGIEMRSGFLADPAIPVRIGIHSGDVVYHEEKIVRDIVYVYPRPESLAVSGSLLVSDKVYNKIKNQQEILTHFIWKVFLKNVPDSLPVCGIVNTPSKILSLDNLKWECLKVRAQFIFFDTLPIFQSLKDKRRFEEFKLEYLPVE